MNLDQYHYRKYLERWHGRSLNPTPVPMTFESFIAFRVDYDREMDDLNRYLHTVDGYNDETAWARIRDLEDLMAL